MQHLVNSIFYFHFPDHKDCVWSTWGPCNSTCGPGIQTRYAEISAIKGGRTCSGKRTRSCDQKPCPQIHQNTPVDCKWSSWSTCNAECGPGDQTRHIEQPALFGGKECEGRDSQYCIKKSCPDNCLWTEWGACSASCGPGGVRRRNYVSQNPYDFHSCIGSEEMACNEKPCPGKKYIF